MTIDKVTEKLIRDLESGDSSRMRALLDIISRSVNQPGSIDWMKLRASTRSLLDICNGDETVLAIETCGFLRDHEAIERLSGLADESDPEIHRAAVVALARIGGTDACQMLLKQVKPGYDTRMVTTLKALGLMDVKSLPQDLAKARHFVLELSKPDSISTETMRELKEWGMKENRTGEHFTGFRWLLASLVEHSHTFAKDAMEILEHIGGPEHPEFLKQMAASGNDDIKIYAREALDRLNSRDKEDETIEEDEEFLDDLLSISTIEKNAALAFADSSLRGLLIEDLFADEEKKREQAADTLCQLVTLARENNRDQMVRECFEPLCDAVCDENSSVKHTALKTLGITRLPEAIDVVRQFLEDGIFLWLTLHEALLSLRLLLQDQQPVNASQQEEIGRQLIELFARENTRDNCPDIIKTLGKIKSDNVVVFLSELLNSGHQKVEYRLEAAQALGDLGTEAALTALKKARANAEKAADSTEAWGGPAGVGIKEAVKLNIQKIAPTGRTGDEPVDQDSKESGEIAPLFDPLAHENGLDKSKKLPNIPVYRSSAFSEWEEKTGPDGATKDAAAYRKAAKLYSRKGKHLKAAELYDKAQKETAYDSPDKCYLMECAGENYEKAGKYSTAGNRFHVAAGYKERSGDLKKAAQFYEKAGDLLNRDEKRAKTDLDYYLARKLRRQLKDMESVEKIVSKTQPNRQKFLERTYSTDETLDCLVKNTLRQASKLWEIEDEELPSLLFSESLQPLFIKNPALKESLTGNGVKCVKAMQAFLPEALEDDFELYLRVFGLMVKEFQVVGCLDQLFQEGFKHPALWPKYRKFIGSGIPEEIAHNALIRYLKSKNGKQRAFALAMAVSLDNETWNPATVFVSFDAQEELVEVMASLLDDACPEVRRYSALAVGSLDDKRAGQHLIRLLDDHTMLPHSTDSFPGTDGSVCCKAAGILGKNKDYRAFRPLIRCLSSSNAALRLAAVTALEYFKDVAVVPYFIETFQGNTFDPGLADRAEAPILKEKANLLAPEEFEHEWDQYQVDLENPVVREERIKKSIRMKILAVLDTFDDEQAKTFVKVNKGEEK